LGVCWEFIEVGILYRLASWDEVKGTHWVRLNWLALHNSPAQAVVWINCDV